MFVLSGISPFLFTMQRYEYFLNWPNILQKNFKKIFQKKVQEIHRCQAFQFQWNCRSSSIDAARSALRVGDLGEQLRRWKEETQIPMELFPVPTGNISFTSVVTEPAYPEIPIAVRDANSNGIVPAAASCDVFVSSSPHTKKKPPQTDGAAPHTKHKNYGFQIFSTSSISGMIARPPQVPCS